MKPQQNSNIEYVVASRRMVGHIGEARVAAYLASFGMKVDRNIPPGSGYDMMINNAYRAEIKTARSHDPYNPVWAINFHRHGKLDESNVDLYIIRLDGVSFMTAGIYLLFRAPVGIKTLRLTARSLLYLYSSHARMMVDFVNSKGKTLPDKIETIKRRGSRIT